MRWGFLRSVARSPAVFQSGEGEGVSCVASVCGGTCSTRLGRLWVVHMYMKVSLGTKVVVGAGEGERALPGAFGDGVPDAGCQPGGAGRCERLPLGSVRGR